MFLKAHSARNTTQSPQILPIKPSFLTGNTPIKA
jgi:hypothetical protein